MGVSPSRLLGREPVERHEHYDADGVLTGVTVVTREPEFTAEDVALLIARRRLQAEVGSHGFTMAEATDPANQFAFEGSKKPKTDYALKAQRDAMDRYYKKWPDSNRNGHLWSVTRRE